MRWLCGCPGQSWKIPIPRRKSAPPKLLAYPNTLAAYLVVGRLWLQFALRMPRTSRAHNGRRAMYVKRWPASPRGVPAAQAGCAAHVARAAFRVKHACRVHGAPWARGTCCACCACRARAAPRELGALRPPIAPHWQRGAPPVAHRHSPTHNIAPSHDAACRRADAQGDKHRETAQPEHQRRASPYWR